MSTTGDESRRPIQSLSTHPVYRTRGEHRHRTDTFDAFSSLDGYGSARADWTGYCLG